jgi:bile acid:Na+ symporter, BASS family
MLKFFQGLSKLLANYTSIFVIGVAVFTFFFPHTFDWVRGTTQTVILGIIMLTMGLTLTTNDFKILAQRPLDVFIGACAQFIIMPGVAYTLVHVWHLDPALALGILLVGCCPGGVSSNIMSYLCHGDVAFSVGMTCASTILAPVMTPLLMKITAGEIIHVDAVGMFINILIVTIIPVAIGCASTILAPVMTPLLMAQGNTARGWAAKKLPARTVARPAFCIPTSMLMVRFLAVLKPASFPASQPSR